MEQTYRTTSCTGQELYTKKWIDENQKEYKGIIQLVHGMQEHTGRYEEFANFLANNGYIVVGHDLIGHGYTSKMADDYGFFASRDGWNKLVEDIHILQNQTQSQYPDLPYLIMGHSMGSLLVRTYVTKYQDNLAGIILSGTSGRKFGLLSGATLAKLIILFKGEKYRSGLLEKLVTGSFNKKFAPNRTKDDWTTSDTEEVDKYATDTKCGKRFTASAYVDLFTGSRYLNRMSNIKKTPNIPILIFSGDKDPVGNNAKGVIRVYQMLKQAGKDKITIRLFKDGRHEMLHEVNRQEVFNFVLSWINSIFK